MYIVITAATKITSDGRVYDMIDRVDGTVQ